MEEKEHLDFEDKLLRYFELKERRALMKEELEVLEEEIAEHFEFSAIQGNMVLQLPNGEWGVVELKGQVVEEFDKDGLAQELLISKDELKTPFDYSLLTAQGKLTPDQISKHTHTNARTKLSIKKRKTKPKKKG